jgi:hypothetical protein
VMVARRAVRRLRTHWTSPHGAHTQRLPETCMTANGVVRGRPLLRPRMVTSRFGPSGTPCTKRNLRIEPKNITWRGATARLAELAGLLIGSLISVRPFALMSIPGLPHSVVVRDVEMLPQIKKHRDRHSVITCDAARCWSVWRR